MLINHGGTEMGQGLHTKMLQVAPTALGVPLERVRTRADPHRQGAQHLRHRGQLRAPTSTAVRSRTPASRSPRGCGSSTPGRELPWDELVREAYFSRVQLWAAGLLPDRGHPLGPTVDAGPPVQVLRLRRRGGGGRGRRLHRGLPDPAGRHRARRRRQPLPARRPRPDRGRLRAGRGLADAGGPALGRVRRTGPRPAHHPVGQHLQAAVARRAARRASASPSSSTPTRTAWSTAPRRSGSRR